MPKTLSTSNLIGNANRRPEINVDVKSVAVVGRDGEIQDLFNAAVNGAAGSSNVGSSERGKGSDKGVSDGSFLGREVGRKVAGYPSESGKRLGLQDGSDDREDLSRSAGTHGGTDGSMGGASGGGPGKLTLSQLRRLRSFTLSELGARIGVSGEAVRCWEQGVYVPDESKIVRLASLLGVSVDDIRVAGRAGVARSEECRTYRSRIAKFRYMRKVLGDDAILPKAPSRIRQKSKTVKKVRLTKVVPTVILGLPKSSGVYLMLFNNGDSYVGASANIRARVAQHISTSRFSSIPAVNRVIAELGTDSFSVEVLELCGKSNLPDRERHWFFDKRPTLNSYVPGYVNRYQRSKKTA